MVEHSDEDAQYEAFMKFAVDTGLVEMTVGAEGEFLFYLKDGCASPPAERRWWLKRRALVGVAVLALAVPAVTSMLYAWGADPVTHSAAASVVSTGSVRGAAQQPQPLLSHQPDSNPSTVSRLAQKGTTAVKAPWAGVVAVPSPTVSITPTNISSGTVSLPAAIPPRAPVVPLTAAQITAANAAAAATLTAKNAADAATLTAANAKAAADATAAAVAAAS